MVKGRLSGDRRAWTVLRSVLVLPRAGGISGHGADAVVVDPDDLARARGEGIEGRPRVLVRVDLERDRLGATVACRPDAVLLADCRGLADLDRLNTRLDVAEAECGLDDGATAVIASVADSAAGLMALVASPSLASRRLAGLTWDAARLAADLGLAHAGWDTGPSGLAAALVPVAARAAGVAALAPDVTRDGATVSDGCRLWRGVGYAGKMTRAVGDVAAINAAFHQDRA